MKNIKILLFTLIICLVPQITVSAAENKENINADKIVKVDGKFDDWMDMPSVEDTQADCGRPSQDLKEMKFYSDDDNLYLYLERYPSSESLNDWDLRVPIIGGTGGTYPNFFPWENGDAVTNDDWVSSEVSTFNISANYEAYSQAFNISIRLGNEVIKSYRLNNVEKNGLAFEVEIPLKKVGLDGPEKSISFNVSSASDQYHKNQIDWIYDEGPIVVTKGPIFGALTPVVAIAGFAGVSIIATKKKKIQDEEEEIN